MSKEELRVIQDAIQQKLEQRAVLREEKVSHYLEALPGLHYTHSHQALLHLLMKISDSVSRLESLLLITSPENVSDNGPTDMPSLENDMYA